ncbi:MAG: hypothetical protein JWN95_291 [Frankiales bacterium]|nr:hypothetical protein [Frankiales bacterium]
MAMAKDQRATGRPEFESLTADGLVERTFESSALADIRVSQKLTEHWSAVGYFFYDPETRTLRLGEVRVVPRGDLGNLHPTRITEARDRFDWSHTADALRDIPAPHSVYKRLLQLVSIDRLVSDAHRYLPEFEHVPEVDAVPSDAELRYLDVAVRYVDASKRFANPRYDVGKALTLSDDQVRDRLRLARAKGYLSRPGPGRTGGELTELGQRLAQTYLRKSTKQEAGTK